MNPRIVRSIFGLYALIVLAACSSGPVRRVSPPTASIQQLTVNADGNWQVELRLQNYSSIPMRFDDLKLALSVAEQPAGELRASPGISIGPESADVVRVALAPAIAAKLVLADALAGRSAVGYALKGTLVATPEDAKPRDFEVDAHNNLNPMPGLQGVLR